MINDDKIFEIPVTPNAKLWEETYHANFYCANCNKHNKRRVKKGVKLNGLFITCDNCGCPVEGKTNYMTLPNITELANDCADTINRFCVPSPLALNQARAAEQIKLAINNAIAPLEKQIAELEESHPMVSNRTKNEARKLLGQVERHSDGCSASHGCVEATNAINVIELLVAERDQLQQANAKLSQEVTVLISDLQSCQDAHDQLQQANAKLTERVKELEEVPKISKQYVDELEITVEKLRDDSFYTGLSHKALTQKLAVVEKELDSIGSATYRGDNFEKHFRDLFYRCEAIKQALNPPT